MKTSRLKEITEVLMGQSPPSDTYNSEGKGLPFYQGKTDFGKIFPVARMWCDRPGKIAEKDDILISVRAPVGPTNICERKSCIGRGLAAVGLAMVNNRVHNPIIGSGNSSGNSKRTENTRTAMPKQDGLFKGECLEPSCGVAPKRSGNTSGNSKKTGNTRTATPKQGGLLEGENLEPSCGVASPSSGSYSENSNARRKRRAAKRGMITNPPSVSNDALPNKDGGKHQFYTSLFWKLAARFLYDDILLTEWQISQAHSLIAEMYQAVPEPKLANAHEDFCDRIGLAKRFVDQDPERRFIQLPHQYFDPSNKHGFAGTAKWLAENKVRKGKFKKHKLLGAQVRKYKRNLKTGAKSQLNVFKECEAVLVRTGDSRLVDAFYRKVL
jgi:hypothetical protein